MSPTSLFLWLTAALRHSRLLGLLGQIDALQFSAARVSSLPFTYQYFLSWTQTLQSLWSRLSKDSLKVFTNANKYYSPQEFLKYCLKLELVESNFKSFTSNIVSYTMKYLLSVTG